MNELKEEIIPKIKEFIKREMEDAIRLSEQPFDDDESKTHEAGRADGLEQVLDEINRLEDERGNQNE